MNEKIITEREIKGNLEFDGKLIFESNLGEVRVEGFIKAGLGIEVKAGTNISSGGYINSGGGIRSGGDIRSGRDIWSGRDIRSGGDIWSGGDISSGGYIGSVGDIKSGGYIWSDGDIYFSFHIKFKTKISCKLLRISRDNSVERNYWIEKFSLFGFKNVVKIISDGCVDKIRAELKGIDTKKILKCKYWTKLEMAVLKSWIDGKLENYELK